METKNPFTLLLFQEGAREKTEGKNHEARKSTRK